MFWIYSLLYLFDTTICVIRFVWFTTGQWISLGTPVSSTNNTDRHYIAEILLNVTLNTITLTLTLYFFCKVNIFDELIKCLLNIRTLFTKFITLFCTIYICFRSKSDPKMTSKCLSEENNALYCSHCWNWWNILITTV